MKTNIALPCFIGFVAFAIVCILCVGTLLPRHPLQEQGVEPNITFTISDPNLLFTGTDVFTVHDFMVDRIIWDVPESEAEIWYKDPNLYYRGPPLEKFIEILFRGHALWGQPFDPNYSGNVVLEIEE
ncbi:hypothetical protein LCGC14_1839520 [marine sediment metagenome]|uniref:Uncharacterized protein n=1 Tax=marine sediment metagenome TaxID=412755 RepID=A0A0F9JD23_9ZZZZ